MWRDAMLIAAKDLRIERRSRVAFNQILPYGGLVLLLFGFAFDQDQKLLTSSAPGLFWVAVLFAALLAVQRSSAIEVADSANDALRMSGLEPAGIFIGKALAVAIQLLILEVLLCGGVVILFGLKPAGYGLLVASALTATAGLAGCGVAYSALAAGLKVRETLLPLLLLPVLAPVLLAAAEAWRAALGMSADDGWKWFGLLACFAAVYLAVGVLAYGSLMEEA